MHIAAEWGNLEAVQYLIEHGLIYDQKDISGYTPIDYAHENDSTEIAEYLVKYEIDQNAHAEERETAEQQRKEEFEIQKNEDDENQHKSTRTARSTGSVQHGNRVHIKIPVGTVSPVVSSNVF